MTAGKSATEPKKTRRQPPRGNLLDGKRWIQNSISVWSDIRKTAEENSLKHPAMFPSALVERLMETFLRPEGRIVLDPFAGSGSTVVTAKQLGKDGIGLELSPEYVALANMRLSQIDEPEEGTGVIHHASATELASYVKPGSVDLCISSPPYWNILNRARTADFKEIRHYGNLDEDIGVIEDYDAFLTAATDIYQSVLTALKPGCYCCIVVMDLRKKSRFFPLHSDLATRLVEAGFLYDDLIIWNRQAEYNNLRPLGYPSVFRVNKVHEFVLLMRKPLE